MPRRQPDAVGDPLVYIAANALVTSALPLDVAVAVAVEGGADGFELRREMLTVHEVPSNRHLQHLLARFSAAPHYSAPVPLFVGDRVQSDAVVQLVSEAASLGCMLAKCSLGTPDSLSPPVLEALSRCLAACREIAPDVLLTVENDQTAPSGDLDLWQQLFTAIHTEGHALGMTFDVGNWRCVGVDALTAAQVLGKDVRYVHVKGVTRGTDASGNWQSLPVQPADVTYPPLTAIAPTVARAIEYPLSGPSREALTAEVVSAVARVRSGAFRL